jgi:hypothetical protein
MATTTNYSWTTPDDTDLVKDGAAAIRTLGSAIDTSLAANEGDLLLGGASNIFEPLAIGAADTVLTSDGTTASWAAPAGGGSNWTSLGSASLTAAATITISGISGVDKVMLLINSASSVNSLAEIQVRLNGDTGNNYYYFGANLLAPATYAPTVVGVVNQYPTSFIQLGALAGSATSSASGYFFLNGANSSGVKQFNGLVGIDRGGNDGQSSKPVGGYYNSASTISSISLVSSSGNFDAGTIYVYTSI